MGELWAVYAPERAPELSSSWRYSHLPIWVHHLGPFFAELHTGEVRDKVDEYVRLRRTQAVLRIVDPAKRKRASIMTIRNEVNKLKALFNWCIERRLLERNPLAGYKVKILKEDLPTIQDRLFHLPENGLQKLLEHLNPVVSRMMIVAFETGMRRDEFRALEWAEVNLETGIIALPAERTKTRAARKIPASTYALDALRTQHALTGGAKYVFRTLRYAHRDEPIARSTLYGQFRRACNKAGIKGPRGQEIWIHTLRKSAGTLNAVMTSLPVKVQMAILGHKSAAVHSQYIDIGESALVDARPMLDQRRGPQAKPLKGE